MKTETNFCVACCKYLPLSEFTQDDEKYICDKCCKRGLEFAFLMAEQVTGKRALIIVGEPNEDKRGDSPTLL